ncbi:MAG: LysR family transcriptional regulator [Gammaproteobacteria bacterium]
MNIRHLAIFHAVARSGSVSGGAEKLHISQPAVSKQLREFEARQGVMLFDRLPRGIRLTEAGRILAGYADKVFLLEQEAQRALDDLQGLRSGRLRVGASTTIGSYLLPEAFVAFRQRYPDVDLNLEVGNTQFIQERLLAGELDIGFTEGFVDSPELEAEAFFMDELVPVAAIAHPLVHGAPISVSRLCREPMLVREPGSGTLAVMVAALARHGVEPRVAMSLGSTEAIKRALPLSNCVAVLSRLAIQMGLQNGTLATIPVRGLRIERPLHQVRVKHRHASAAESAFLELLPTQTG